ncbi:MAG TPA: serine/threonine-protein kinase, partial [Candidatus Binatus sp.]|nr:serine/threonine-protein kinase [Candidatus Binatus sp.]
GGGTFGEVWRARHHVWVDQLVAIKIPTDTQYVRALQREGVAIHGLMHPNIVRAIGFDPYADPPYLTMEYVPGSSLRPIIKNKNLKVADAVAIMRQVLTGLAHAHERGVIHRDIKPANLMLCERGGLLDFVKVLDFGLVRPVEQTEELALTNVKSLTGTPLYLSPDLIQAADSVDARSDVYQLGAVAYYLLTGTHVFRGVNIYEVCAQHLHTEPEPPAARLGRPVASDLAGVILRCLAKDGAQRPASAEALLAALAACADAGTWTQADARAWWLAWGDRLGGTAVRRPGEDPGSPSVVHIDLGARRA